MPRNDFRIKKRRFAKKPPPPPSSDSESVDSNDSSVDSKGNLRNLIDYDYSESEEDVRRKPRKAAMAARKALKTMAAEAITSESSSAATPPPPRRRIAPTLVVAESSDDEPVVVKKKKKVIEVTDDEESEEEEVKPVRRRTAAKPSRRVVEEESESSEDDTELRRRKAKQQKKKKRVEESEEETDDDEEEDEDEDEDEDTEEDEDYTLDSDEDDDAPRGKRRSGFDIIISDMFGGGGGGGKEKPQKYNLKKESPAVRRFVELVQKEAEGEEDTIDNDITYFKSLSPEKQTQLMQALEYKASPAEVQVPLKFKILERVATKPELQRIAMAKYNALCNLDPSSSEYYKCGHWIQGFTNLPLGVYKDLPIKLEDGPEKCHEFMGTVHKCMESAIYGHSDAKLQIMQFVSSWIANPKAHGNVLSIHGPPGVGKTSLVKDGIAKALGRPFHFITLGGATDASFLDGHSYTYEGSTWGRIIEVLIQSKCMNPVIYFDELDKISETAKGDEIMNMLIHITDGSQNERFQDKYFTGIDIDLSRCLFIFSQNNHEKVNPILRDRMFNIAVKGFSVKEKLQIAEDYLLPGVLKESGLYEKVSISKEILQFVIENYTGGEAGVRELKRCIQTIISKLNLLRFYNNPKQIPFAIEGFSLPFILKKSHVELFLKRKADVDESIQHLYI